METFKQFLTESFFKITKKQFLDLHKNGKLGLVAGGVKQDAKKIIEILKKNIDKIEYKKTTRVDVGDGPDTKNVIYHAEISGKTFFILETIIDNSKNPGVSWDTIDTYSNVYILI